MPRPNRRVVSGHGPAPTQSSPPGSGSGSSGGAVSQPQSRSVSASSAGSASASGIGSSGYDLASSTSSLASASGGSPAASPAKLDRSVSQYEVLYNTAVQAFVRRDHGKAQATLGKLLDLLSNERAQAGTAKQAPWWDLGTVSGSAIAATSPSASGSSASAASLPLGGTSIDEWTVRALKLLISSLASLYADPSPLASVRRSSLPESISALLSPTPADRILTYLHAQCVTHAVAPPALGPDGTRAPYNPASTLLPPSLLSTLVLAALKIPGGASVEWAHRLAEDWIGALPDAFFIAISPSTVSSARRRQIASAAQNPTQTVGAGHEQVALQKLEAAREGYIKVVELFVGEILVREGEWEMARAFLEGESVIGSKRKENLYKHIRTAERARTTFTPTSSASNTPDNSLILPSPTVSGASGTIRPSSFSAATAAFGSQRRTRRSQTTSSAASSESEATARPGFIGGGGMGSGEGGRGSRVSSTPVSPLTARLQRPMASGAVGSSTAGTVGAGTVMGTSGTGEGSSSSFLHPNRSITPGGTGKGAGAGGGDDRSVSESTRSTLPSRIFVNPFPSLGRHTSSPGHRSPSGIGRNGSASPHAEGEDDDEDGNTGTRRAAGWSSLLVLLPRSVRARIEPIVRSPWLLALILGIPTLLGTVIGALILRRLFRRYVSRLRARREGRVLGVRRNPNFSLVIGVDGPAPAAASASASVGSGAPLRPWNSGKTASPAGIGGAVAPLSPLGWNRRNSAGDLVVHDLKQRMARQREGWVRWVRQLVGWWLAKIWGVWEMGTTITYI